MRSQPAIKFFFDTVLNYEGDECLIWPHSRAGGRYAKAKIDGKHQLIHRYLCRKIHGDPPSKDHVVRHTCGRGEKGCVTKSHIKWGTRLENEADKIKHGTKVFGERCHNAVINEQIVREIRALRGKKTQPAIAAQFGVSISLVCDVQLRKSWAHVQ